MVIGIYIFYNLVYSLFAYPLGILADKIGLKRMFIIGIFIFSIVYFGMSVASNWILVAILFFFYGIYAAATEGISKAWISKISEKNEVATAIGFYTGIQSIFAMLASILAGFLWFQYGASITFFVTGFSSLLVVIYFAFSLRNYKV
jgi:MFS family permease